MPPHARLPRHGTLQRTGGEFYRLFGRQGGKESALGGGGSTFATPLLGVGVEGLIGEGAELTEFQGFIQTVCLGWG